MKAALAVTLLALAMGCSSDLELFGGGSEETITVQVNGLAAPSALAGQMQSGGHSILFTWADNSTVETGFRVEVADQPMASLADVDDWVVVSANATSYSYSSRPGRRYFARIYAVTDTLQSAPSNQIEVITATAPPEAPSGLVADGWSSSSIRLTWSDVAEEGNYIIERSDDGTAWYEIAGDVPADQTTYTDSGLTPNTTYWYRVAASNPLGTSGYSNEDSGTTLWPNTSTTTYFTEGEDDGYNTSLALDGFNAYVAYYNATSTTTLVRGPGPLRTIDGAAGALGTSTAVWGGLAHIATIAPNQLRRSSGTSGGGFSLTVVNPANGWHSLPRIVVSGFGREYVGRAGGGASLLYWGEPWSGTAGGNFITSSYPLIHGLAFVKDPDGHLHIAFTGSTNGGGTYSLVYGFKNVGAVAWNLTTLPAPTSRPTDVSIATERTGTGPTPTANIPHIVYYDSASGQLHHIWRPNLLIGTGYQHEVIDAPPGRNVGAHNSMVLSGNTLHVAYYDATEGDLRYAKRVFGSPWQLGLLDAAGDVGTYTSIAAAGSSVYVAYRDNSNQDLKLVSGTP